jgi:hypothetical protein
LFRTNSINFVNFFSIWIVGIQAPKLTFHVPEQEKKMGAVATIDHIQDSVAGLGIHDPGEHNVFDGVKDNAAVGLCGRFSVESSP